MIETDYLKESEKMITDLRKIPVLKPFTADDLKRLLRMSKIRKYIPGELVFREGYLDSMIFFLVSGKVRVEKNGEELAILSHRGDVFGEMGAIDGSPRSATITAIDTTVCLATETDLIKKLTGNDQIAFGYILYRIFAEILAARLRVTNQELMEAREKAGWSGVKNMFSKFTPGSK